MPAAKKPRMESGDTKGLAGTAFWGRWPGALKKSGKTPLMKIKPSKNTSHLRCNLQYIGSRLSDPKMCRTLLIYKSIIIIILLQMTLDPM
jgi:hypothetical protein